MPQGVYGCIMVGTLLDPTQSKSPMKYTATAPRRPVRLLVLDVDGTLTNSCHEITDATCAAIASVRERGVRVMLATGRRYRDVLPVFQRLHLDVPLVTASGALVKRVSDHATLFKAEFAPGVLEEVLRLIVSRGHEPILYADSFADGFDFYIRSLPPATGVAVDVRGLAEYLDRNRLLARVDPHLDSVPPPRVFAGFAMGTHGHMRALEECLDAGCPGSLSLHTIRSPRYRDWMCEIAPAGVTKWSGVLSVADALGIDPDEIWAVGDDVNDLPMLLGAGRGIAMGNAAPAVLAVANDVVATHDEGGIEQVAAMLLAELS